MTCELHVDPCWPALLQARELLDRRCGDVAWIRRDGAWTCGPVPALLSAADEQLLVLRDPRAAPAPLPAANPQQCVTVVAARRDGPPEVAHPQARAVDAAALATARAFWPVLTGHAQAAQAGRIFVVAHVTQTLDGRIACHNGQSQWIGNVEDQRHSHRMRALVDAVLCGAGTVRNDDPKLTVRHVNGPQPRRLVLNGSGSLLASGRPFALFAEPGCDLFVRDGALPAAWTANAPAAVRVHRLPAADVGELPAADVLRAIAALGVRSIYLEGGAGTLSAFVRAGAVDLLQVHIANLLLGSGLPSFALPAVDHVDHGQRFAMDHAALDGHLLLSCWPLRGVHGAAP